MRTISMVEGDEGRTLTQGMELLQRHYSFLRITFWLVTLNER